MKRSRPNAVHILVVCSWNVKGDGPSRDACYGRALPGENVAGGGLHWILRRLLEPGAMERPKPKTAFQTYIHDDMKGTRDFERTFCNDEALFTTLTLHAGVHGAHLCSNLKHIFRYIYHYNHGGLYFDIKFGFKVTVDTLSAASGAGLGPCPTAAERAEGTRSNSERQAAV